MDHNIGYVDSNIFANVFWILKASVNNQPVNCKKNKKGTLKSCCSQYYNYPIIREM